MRVRSLSAQMNYCITSCFKGGTSKRADRKNGVNTHKCIYSVQTAENLRDTANNICHYMDEAYPKVRLVKDITTEHIQAWIDARSPHWSDSTLREQLSRLNKLSEVCSTTYGISLDWSVPMPNRAKAHNIKKLRTYAMEKVDLLALKHDLSQPNRSVNALKAVELASRCGLRCKEIARLRTDCIDLDKRQIIIAEGAKNGKKRVVPIRNKDLKYFVQLKSTLAHEYVTEGVSEDSLNKAIRRSMERIGLADKYKNTTIHAIRKAYATERYTAELKKHKGNERKAWEIVQKELGHGERYRKELFQTYIVHE